MLCAGPQIISRKAAGLRVPAGVIVAYEGTVASIPAPWALCDGTNGTPDLRGRFVVGSDASHPVQTAGGGSTITATCSTDGTHTGPASDYIETSGESTIMMAGTAAAGGHAHPLSGSVSWTPPHYTICYIRSSAEANLPAGALVWHADAAAPSGWTAHAMTLGRYLAGVGDDGRAQGGSLTATYDLTVATAGAHQHVNAQGGDYGGGAPAYYNMPGGAHTHTAAGGSATIPNPPSLALLVITSAAGGKVVRRMVLAYDGAAIPAKWALCDGTNGTPDLRGRYPVGADGAALAVGTSTGSAAAVAISGALSTAVVPHNHYTASGGQDDQPKGGQHGDYGWSHSHTYAGSISPAPQWYAVNFITPA